MKTWALNPKFTLNFNDIAQPAYLKITLAIADKNWKAVTKNVVGGMIGIYLLEKSERVSLEDKVNDPSFIPLNTTIEVIILFR